MPIFGTVHADLIIAIDTATGHTLHTLNIRIMGDFFLFDPVAFDQGIAVEAAADFGLLLLYPSLVGISRWILQHRNWYMVNLLVN